MTSQLSVLCIDAIEPSVIAAFWCKALGWIVLDEDDSGIEIGPPGDNAAFPRIDIGQGDDVSWVVLADPEGNEFCVLSKSVEDLRESNQT